MHKTINTIVVIGSGNVATSLVPALFNAGYTIAQIYSRTLEHAKQLANSVQASCTNNATELLANADLYIITVPDKEIENILRACNFGNSLVVHTAGSLPISVFNNYTPNCGVLYPVQTFSKSKRIDDFSAIPIFIEAQQPQHLILLQELAGQLSKQVLVANSQQRLALHVSAIYACNFVNCLLGIATDIMEQNGLDKNLLNPLIHETIEKALAAENPHDVQTGPAVRLDRITMQCHDIFLEDREDWQEIYRVLSGCIIRYKYEE